MNKLKEWYASVRRWANAQLLADPKVLIVDAEKQADLLLELSQLRSALRFPEPVHITPANKYELAQKELGSYIPNLEPLADKADEFKNSLGRLCMEIRLSPEFQYLINHIKQDQVNLSLFTERKSEDWVLGSINGVYVVEEQINLLGLGYEERYKKGLIPNTNTPEPKPTS